jgi:hypothetical protein
MRCEPKYPNPKLAIELQAADKASLCLSAKIYPPSAGLSDDVKEANRTMGTSLPRVPHGK